MRSRQSCDYARSWLTVVRPVPSITLVVLLVSTSAHGHAQAQSPAAVTAELGYRSRYLFAGVPFVAGNVLEGTVTVEAGSLTMAGNTVYGSDGGEVIEADVWGDYQFQPTPAIGAFLGASYYSFLTLEDDGSTVWEGTPELYMGVVLTAPLTPTLTVAHDFDLGDGTHATLSLYESFPIGSSPLSLDVGGDLDYNHRYYVEIDGFSYADLWVSVNVSLGALTLSPVALFQFGLDESTFLGEPNFPDEQVYGVTATVTF